jgi:hypothetical protein
MSGKIALQEICISLFELHRRALQRQKTSAKRSPEVGIFIEMERANVYIALATSEAKHM